MSNLNASLRSRQLTSRAENGVGDEVASKVLDLLLAKPASVSTGTASIVPATGFNSDTALISTTYSATGPTGPTGSSPILLPLSEKLRASVSTPRSHGAVIASKPTVSASFITQAPGYGSLTQASATPSISVTANKTGNATTITSLPAAFSTFTASNPLWTSDTSTKINGTIFPVWYLGHHQGIVLAGLGGKPDDPVRPGCSGLFKSFFWLQHLDQIFFFGDFFESIVMAYLFRKTNPRIPMNLVMRIPILTRIPMILKTETIPLSLQPIRRRRPMPCPVAMTHRCLRNLILRR